MRVHVCTCVCMCMCMCMCVCVCVRVRAASPPASLCEDAAMIFSSSVRRVTCPTCFLPFSPLSSLPSPLFILLSTILTSLFHVPGHTDTVTGLQLSPDGNLLLSNAMVAMRARTKTHRYMNAMVAMRATHAQTHACRSTSMRAHTRTQTHECHGSNAHIPAHARARMHTHTYTHVCVSAHERARKLSGQGVAYKMMVT